MLAPNPLLRLLGTRSLSDIAVRDKAKEMRQDARPQARKNRKCIHWTTLRIFSCRERRRWLRIVRRSRKVTVGPAPSLSHVLFREFYPEDDWRLRQCSNEIYGQGITAQLRKPSARWADVTTAETPTRVAQTSNEAGSGHCGVCTGQVIGAGHKLRDQNDVRVCRSMPCFSQVEGGGYGCAVGHRWPSVGRSHAGNSLR